MHKKIVQLIPNLIQLETNANKISNFSFWDNAERSGFFKVDNDSKYKFSYYIKKDIPKAPNTVTLQFSNLTYFDKQWFYYGKKGPIELKFYINERTGEFSVNRAYHELFIKIGYLQPSGCILTDYIVYQIEKSGIIYHDGAAACLGDKTFLFFGAGRNFKTTSVGFVLENGGSYIGEESFLLNGNNVYATIPNAHRFDLRTTHKKLFENDLSKRKTDTAEYNIVVFLVYSDHDEIKEIDITSANEYAALFHHSVNTYYYNFFRSKDIFLNEKSDVEIIPLKNKKARYFVVRFTNVQTVFNFIKKI